MAPNLNWNPYYYQQHYANIGGGNVPNPQVAPFPNGNIPRGPAGNFLKNCNAWIFSL